MVIVEAATLNVANFVIGNKVNVEADSTMLTKLQELSQNNSIVGAPTHDKLVSDSPMIECLNETAGQGENSCAAGIAYVFFERRSQGKSSAARYFCRKACKVSGCRSILIGATGIEETYFQRVATNLDVGYTSNWARCLVSAMAKSPREKFNPFLFLDEFNRGTERDLQELNMFMRVCQNRGFYLIIITSEKRIADEIMKLNAWGKMRPLQFIHNGPITNIRGQPGYDENKTADWKQIDWTLDQLKSLVIMAEGEFDDYGFIVAGMTPTDALFEARRLNHQQQDQSRLAAPTSHLSTGD
jgi:hypothetical protein